MPPADLHCPGLTLLRNLLWAWGVLRVWLVWRRPEPRATGGVTPGAWALQEWGDSFS